MSFFNLCGHPRREGSNHSIITKCDTGRFGRQAVRRALNLDIPMTKSRRREWVSVTVPMAKISNQGLAAAFRRRHREGKGTGF